jgi:hypothetical protein
MVRSSIIWSIALAVCFWAALPGSASAIETSDPRDAKILSELNTPTMIDFTNVSLSEGLEYLVEYHDITIGIDEIALKDVKVTPRTPFTYKTPRDGNKSTFPLYRALWELLGGSNVSFMIVDHKLLITSAKQAKEWQADFVKKVESQRR